MNIHEYQAKQLLKQYGVAVPRGIPAFSVDEAVAAAKSSVSTSSRRRSTLAGAARPAA